MRFLELSGLQKTFADGTEAVRGIDLACEEGEFGVLLGPSGCGKTTTLRMIAGLEIPTRGRIWMGGEDITERRAGDRDVGFVFQFYALYPHLRVRDNIAFPLESMGVPRQERKERVKEVIQRLGLEALAERYPEQLSGGDQQRVALARAMVRRPRLHLMDEPLGTLDADLRLEMRELIRSQQLEMGITTVYVTHDQEEAMSLADRVVVMEGGRIRQSGPPAQVYDRPADLFVAHFIGSPGMNCFEGEVRQGAFAAAGLEMPLAQKVRPGRAILGVRPEFIRPDTSGVLRAEVIMDEYMGSCRNVYLEAACGRLAMRGEREGRWAPGEHLVLGLDPEHVLFFDPETGRRLDPDPPGPVGDRPIPPEQSPYAR